MRHINKLRWPTPFGVVMMLVGGSLLVLMVQFSDIQFSTLWWVICASGVLALTIGWIAGQYRNEDFLRREKTLKEVRAKLKLAMSQEVAVLRLREARLHEFNYGDAGWINIYIHASGIESETKQGIKFTYAIFGEWTETTSLPTSARRALMYLDFQGNWHVFEFDARALEHATAPPILGKRLFARLHRGMPNLDDFHVTH